MKLVRFGKAGKEKAGSGRRSRQSCATSARSSSTSTRTRSDRARSRASRKSSPNSLPAVRGAPRIGPCVAGVRNFVAVGLNYADHAAETGAAAPKEPVLFNKAPSCIVGPNDDVVVPKGSTKLDWEVELAVVIGTRASYVGEDEALKHVAGYCICNDVSERAFQIERGGQWMKGKGCPTFGPLGPWLVTPDEIADAQKLGLWLDVNGERMQNGSTATMIFGVKTLVSYISQFMILEPGDVITTGTPAGVGLGKKPPVFLKAGRHGLAGDRGPRAAGAEGRRPWRRMRRDAVSIEGVAAVRLWSWTGFALAAFTALVLRRALCSLPEEAPGRGSPTFRSSSPPCRSP